MPPCHVLPPALSLSAGNVQNSKACTILKCVTLSGKWVFISFGFLDVIYVIVAKHRLMLHDGALRYDLSNPMFLLDLKPKVIE